MAFSTARDPSLSSDSSTEQKKVVKIRMNILEVFRFTFRPRSWHHHNRRIAKFYFLASEASLDLSLRPHASQGFGKWRETIPHRDCDWSM